MTRDKTVTVWCALFSAMLASPAWSAQLELQPQTSVITVGDRIEFVVYGKEFPDGVDGGDFSLSWTGNLVYVDVAIQEPPFDLSSVADEHAVEGYLEYVDVFSSLATPGLGGVAFPIARLTLEATAQGPAFVTIGTNLVGWSLAGDLPEYSIGPAAQIEIRPLPEPGLATSLAFALGLLGSFARARRRKR